MTTPVSEQKVSPEPSPEFDLEAVKANRDFWHKQCLAAWEQRDSAISAHAIDEADRVRLFHENRALESQLEEARRDTERLNWLEAHADERFRNYDLVIAPVENIAPAGWNGCASLREAIDHAADSARGAPHG